MMKMVSLCTAKNGAFISVQTFSLGVNIFFEINEYLAKMMAKLDHYSIEMETHHTQKLDAPRNCYFISQGVMKIASTLTWT
jgi:4-hydroxy-tetrahydrodipicolinate reductase